MSIIRKEQLTNPLSASYALTASYAENANTSTVNTGSLLTTASVSLNTITFTKGNGSTFPITVNTGSGGGGTPGGSNTTIQFNNNNAFSGSENFIFNKDTNLITIQKEGTQYTSPPSIIPNTSSLYINGNIDVLGKIQTNEVNIYTQTFPQIKTLPYGKSFEWDIGKSGSIALITLSEDATEFDINYFGNSLSFTKGILIVKQDNIGGWVFPLPTTTGGSAVNNYVQDNGGGTYTPTPDPNAYDILEFISLNKTLFWSIKYNFT